MSKITIIDGNNEIELSTAPKENIKAYMVKGEPGTNGVSPSAVVTKTGDTSTLTVTDANGTTQSNIMDGYNPTITVEKENKVTTLTITDINGTATTEIYDGLDITGGVPTNAVMGFDVTELIYTCDGTESGTYYFTYDNVDYYFTMPTVSDGDKLIFNIDDLELTLDGNVISTSSSGTGTELTFVNSIPDGYEITDEKLGGADIPQQATAPLNPEENDLWIDTDETGLTVVDSTVSTSSTNPVENQAITNYVNEEINKLENYIMVGLTQETTIETTSTTKFPLDTNISSNGSRLTFDPINNCIVVGQGVSKIELSGMIYVFTIPTTDLVAIYIYKNSNAYARFSHYLRDNYQSITIPNVVMDVQQGDKIYIYVNNSAQPTKYGGNVSGSYLTNSFIAKVVK